MAVVARRAQMDRSIGRVLERIFDDVPNRLGQLATVGLDALDAVDAVVDDAAIVQAASGIALAAQELGDVDAFDVRRRLGIEPRQAASADRSARACAPSRATSSRGSGARFAAPRSHRGASTSMYPPITVSGVRSSCEASAANCRMRSSACLPMVDRRRDARDGIVERRGQRRHLIAAAHDETALRVVTVRERSQGIAHLVDRPQRLLREEPSDEPGQQDRRSADRQNDAPIWNQRNQQERKRRAEADVAALDVRERERLEPRRVGRQRGKGPR